MSALVFIIVIAIVAALIVFLVGHAMGRPAVGRKFDETAADVSPMDVSDGTPLNDIWIPARPKTISAEEIAVMEKFGNQMKSERRP